MKKIPTSDAASMPPKTGQPTAWRDSAAAPDAVISGTRPRMKAKDVIITARNRIRAPSAAASRSGTPASRRSLANSTIRMPFFAASAISTTRPICAYTVSPVPETISAAKEPSPPTATESSTGSGIVQLS